MFFVQTVFYNQISATKMEPSPILFFNKFWQIHELRKNERQKHYNLTDILAFAYV